MKLLVLVLSTIVVFGCLVHGTSGEDVETTETPAVAEDAEIEEKVAQIMDETELPGLVNEDNAQEENLESKGESSDDCVKEQIEVSSGNDGTEVELIEEAKENKFTFMCLFHGKNYERYYQKINNYLVDKLGEDDNTDRNMREALNWIAKLENSTFKDRNLIKALKQLTSLTKIGGDNMCTKNAYGILRKNDLATRGRAHRRRTKLGAMSRVEKMVHQYSIQHAIDCFHEYPRKFAIKRSQLDPVQLNRVEPLINQIFRTVLKPKFLGIFAIDAVRENIDPTELVRDIKYLDKADIAEVVLKQLESYAKDDPDRKYLDYVNDDRTAKFIIREDKIKDLFEKYIVSPCEYYIKQLGFDILIPMRFDVQMLESEDRYLLDNDQVTDFYIGYANFRACNLIVYQDRKALARRLVRAAQKKNKPKD